MKSGHVSRSPTMRKLFSRKMRGHEQEPQAALDAAQDRAAHEPPYARTTNTMRPELADVQAHVQLTAEEHQADSDDQEAGRHLRCLLTVHNPSAS